MNYKDAIRENIPPSRRARVVDNSRTVYVQVLVSKTIVPPGHIALNDKALSMLRVREGDEVIVKVPSAPRSIKAIHKRLRETS